MSASDWFSQAVKDATGSFKMVVDNTSPVLNNIADQVKHEAPKVVNQATQHIEAAKKIIATQAPIIAAALHKDAEKAANQVALSAQEVINAAMPAVNTFANQVAVRTPVIASQVSEHVKFAVNTSAPIAADILMHIEKDPAIWVAVGAGLATGALLPVIVPPLLHVVGFSPTGVQAGSSAAHIQSSFGGNIVAGSAFAIAQSLSMGGDIPGPIMLTVTGGAALSAYLITKAIQEAHQKKVESSKATGINA